MKASILSFRQTGNTLKAGISIGNGLQSGWFMQRKWNVSLAM